MKYILAFSLLFLAACDKEETDPLCEGPAKYDLLEGTWVKDLGSVNGVDYSLQVKFPEPGEEEAEIIYSCEDGRGALASMVKTVTFFEHSPELISLFATGIMRPENRDSDLRCLPYSFGGKRFEVTYEGECMFLDDQGLKHKFTKGVSGITRASERSPREPRFPQPND